ncbi:MAG: fasciclin domain-containing protein [Pseudomonadota bacterium]
MKTLFAAIAGATLLAAPAIAEHHPKAGHEQQADIVDTAAAAGSFTTLLAAAEAAGMVDALKGEGPLTVFAPNDDAFAALPEGTVETLLLPENQEQLAGILKLHVIAGAKVTSDQLAGVTTTAETLNGEVAIDGTDGVKVNDATVIAADVKASNGVIHVIDKVLLPAT